MPKKSAPAGTYILTGVHFSQRNEDGSYIDYEQGDEVELNAAEAARLLTGPITSFVKKDNGNSTDASNEKPQLREMNK